jgi:hypothetical protein
VRFQQLSSEQAEEAVLVVELGIQDHTVNAYAASPASLESLFPKLCDHGHQPAHDETLSNQAKSEKHCCLSETW